MDAAPQHSVVTEVQANLAFARPDEVVDDNDGRGIKRARTRPLDEEFSQQFELRCCGVRDWSAPGEPPLDLPTMGFESVDLGGNVALQTLLAQVRSSGEISGVQARHLRRQLTGSVFPLAGGKCLKLLSVAPEGLIMRKSGPNGLKADPKVAISEMNGHDAAAAVHGDQDVRGTPLKQIMRKFAPWLFRHQTPDGSNKMSPLMLVNLWVPLQQITRPLTLMDRRTLNAREHQLRYALPTDSFLERDDDTKMNDIWSFLHDDAQQWYFHSNLGHDKAYVFDTLGEPHGSFILPGEDVVEYYYLALIDACDALRAGRVPATVQGSPPVLAAETTAPLRAAIDEMSALFCSVPDSSITLMDREGWLAQADRLIDAVVRKSIEVRVVALLLPDRWPFNRGA